MAVDKIVDGTALDNNLTSVANAIRTKGGTSGSLSFPSGFVSAINAIVTGGGAAVRETSEFSLTAGTINLDNAYNANKIYFFIPTGGTFTAIQTNFSSNYIMISGSDTNVTITINSNSTATISGTISGVTGYLISLDTSLL